MRRPLRGPVGGLGLELLEDVVAGAGAGLGEDRAGAAAGVEALGAVGLAVGAERRMLGPKASIASQSSRSR